jgi:hypothetical protein
MTFIEFVGYVGCIAGIVMIVCALWTACGIFAFRSRWKWGDAKQIKRSVKLGWNAGEPPDGAWLLIREHMGDLSKSATGWQYQNHSWAVMQRRGDRCYTKGGSSFPVTNITGWLEIVNEMEVEQ